MLSSSEVILQPSTHSALTTSNTKNLSYSIQTVVPHCSSAVPIPAGRIVLVPPGAGVAKLNTNNSDLSSCSALAAGDLVPRSMLPVNKNMEGSGRHANSGGGGGTNGSSMAPIAPVTTAPVPFIRNTMVGNQKGVGHVHVMPQQMSVSSQNMQSCSPVAIQHPILAPRQQQPSSFVPLPKAIGGEPQQSSFYLYDDQTTTYQCLGVSPPNVTPGIVQNMGQQGGGAINFSQHSNICGVPSVVRIPQRNTAQNRSSVTNTMQYFPVNMQQEAPLPPPPPMFQPPPQPQSSPSQLVVSGSHSTGAPYLPPSASGIQHSPNWPQQQHYETTSSERSFESLATHQPPPKISTEHNLLMKTEKDSSSCYRQMSAPCVSQLREETGLPNRTASQLSSGANVYSSPREQCSALAASVVNQQSQPANNSDSMKAAEPVGVPSTPLSQQSAQSSKSSPSPVEFSLEMDLANLPAFNFNLDEICEDVLFPEKDDFDDIFIDDLTITPSPPYACSSAASSNEKTLHNLDHCGDGVPKAEPGSRLPGASNFGASTFADCLKIEDDKGIAQSCHGRSVEGAYGGGLLSSSPTNYADLPSRGANEPFENMDYKSSDRSCAAIPTTTDGSPSRCPGASSWKGSKQQVSPSPSYASCLGSAGVGNVRRRRRPGVDRPSSSGEACTICGDKASGYHYNALSCEGCKGFFRRSVTNDRKYTCERNGECNIDIYMRRKCQKCRLDRCYAAGMRKECLMSVEQCRSMQAKRKSRSGPSGAPNSASGGANVLGANAMQTAPGILSGVNTGMPSVSGGVLPSNVITTNLGANMTQLPPASYPQPASNTSQLFVNPQRSSANIDAADPCITSNPPYHHTTLQATSPNSGSVTDRGMIPTNGTNGSTITNNGTSCNDPVNDGSRDAQALTSSMQQLMISIPPQYDIGQELSRTGMSPEQVSIVRSFVTERWSVGMPNIEKIKYLPPWPGRTGDARLTSLRQDQQRQMKFQHMTHLTRICMEGVIGLAKKLRNFSKLSQQDQIRIVKPACLEILMINSAQYFDVATDRLLMATGHWTSHEQMEDGLLKYGFGTQMWQYVRTLAQMKLHDIEFTLLTALSVYSPDRAGLTNEGRLQVSQFQQPYRNCLEIYCRSVYPQTTPGTPSRMAQLMSKLYELRSVSFQHGKYIYGIQLNKSNWEPLPQLLGEIFDQGSEACSEEETSPPLNNNNSEIDPPVCGNIQQQQNPLSACSPVSASSTSQPTSCSSPAHPTAAVSTGAKQQYAHTGHAPSLVSMASPTSIIPVIDNNPSSVAPK